MDEEKEVEEIKEEAQEVDKFKELEKTLIEALGLIQDEIKRHIDKYYEEDKPIEKIRY